MEQFNEIVGKLTGIVWGPWMTSTLVGIGIYFTLGTKFLQVRKFGYIMKETIGKVFNKNKNENENENAKGTITPFQAVSSALASTVGVGNIVGVSSALAFGGPGAIFWMWVSAFFGMCTKYAEIVLSIEFREQNEEGEYLGGPAYYMKNGLKAPFLGIIFTIALSVVCLGGNMIQSNSIAGNMEELFKIPPYMTGIILIILVAIVSLGGIKRLGKVAEKLVPIMAVVYIAGGILVMLVNFKTLPSAFASIFINAFSTTSVVGGVGGYAVKEAIKLGIVRGLYSNEAGQGTAPIAHAAATTDHPVRQGMWGVFEVFFDTMIICTITALTILSSGVLASGESPAILASLAFGTVNPILKYIVGLSLITFAYTTIIALGYYGESLFNYLGGAKLGKMYRYLFLPFTIIGSIGGLQTVWGVQDLLMGIQVIPNLIAIVLLSPIVFKRTNEFFDNEKLSNNSL